MDNIEMVEEEIKTKRLKISSLKEGDIINNCIFISHEGFDINNTGGQYIHLGKFRCNCGNNFISRVASVKNGHTSSCGCYNKRRVIEGNTTHNLSKHPLYFTWYRMVHRCNTKESKDYKDYGGRGIKVCADWEKDVNIFYNWSLNNGWNRSLSIERMDNNGNYCPENCKWTTAKEQARNRRSSRMINYNNKMITVAEYCETNNISYATISKRINKLQWSIEDALNTKIRSHHKRI